MEIITSKQNNIVKEAKALQNKTERIKSFSFLVEGFKIIDEAFKSGYKIKTIFCLEKFLDKARQLCDNIVLVNDNIIEHLSSTMSPQGVVAIVEQKKDLPELKNNERFLILDKIQNPDNMGGIIRSAAAFGVNHIFLLNCCEQFNEKVIRSAMGNLFKISIEKTDLLKIENLSKEREIFCADMDGKDVSKIDKFANNCGLVIGNEGNGISQKVMQFCNNKICIPMQNNVESLNACVSASILMFEISKR